MTSRRDEAAEHSLPPNPTLRAGNYAGRGKMASAVAYSDGFITPISLPWTCMTNGWAPVFWPFSILVAP
ncbi:MAG: hypothetical protein HOJ10_07290 [Marinovum sp.]|nr:hypothetical protein [Marinovum sp.]